MRSNPSYLCSKTAKQRKGNHFHTNYLIQTILEKPSKERVENFLKLTTRKMKIYRKINWKTQSIIEIEKG